MFGPGPTRNDIAKIAEEVYEKRKSREKASNVNPFSDYTLKLKRNLLAVSCFGILVDVSNFEGGRINFFGMYSGHLGLELTHGIIGLVIFYLFFSFLWWAIDELRDWKVSTMKNLIEESEKSLSHLRKAIQDWEDKIRDEPGGFTVNTIVAAKDFISTINCQIGEASGLVKNLHNSAKMRVSMLTLAFPLLVAALYFYLAWRQMISGIWQILRRIVF